MDREGLAKLAALTLAGFLAASTSPALADGHGKKKKKGHCEAISCGGTVKVGNKVAKNSCGGHAACPGADGKKGTADDPWNKSKAACKKAGGKWKMAKSKKK